ncbi:MAG TPA: hypothetical protein VHB77_02695 [Planctomycetaceae bacterium]|nr:hypothetical protein [Planctomycetaceae bacterium]
MSPAPSPAPAQPRRSRTATTILVLLVISGALAGALIGLRQAYSEPVVASIPASPEAAAPIEALPSEPVPTANPAPDGADAQPEVAPEVDPRIALLIGSWKGHYKGERTLEVRADDTATMVSKPEGFAATAFASRLQFEIEWTLDGDELTFKTTGGEPEGKVQFILKLYGTERRHKIVSLEPEKMVLLDEDGKTEYLWERVTDDGQDDAELK